MTAGVPLEIGTRMKGTPQARPGSRKADMTGFPHELQDDPSRPGLKIEIHCGQADGLLADLSLRQGHAVQFSARSGWCLPIV
ncbi:hypothetical protein EJC49_02595 [Aquibium carbonis]|uniref:Uncharacterized protein n=1 Tax=Aquibium carbonis TaxID=2495581 RepID=A0A3R9YAQ5_9HYPH|nr:hypothetical protein [Aquibium carbonis]RST88045.1 hypothetical protein EJC49_02595 [Aquibium carbonis]